MEELKNLIEASKDVLIFLESEFGKRERNDLLKQAISEAELLFPKSTELNEMTVQELNNYRANRSIDVMNKNKTLLWLMVGITKDGHYHPFMMDNLEKDLTSEKVAASLEHLAKSIREEI